MLNVYSYNWKGELIEARTTDRIHNAMLAWVHRPNCVRNIVVWENGDVVLSLYPCW